MAIRSISLLCLNTKDNDNFSNGIQVEFGPSNVVITIQKPCKQEQEVSKIVNENFKKISAALSPGATLIIQLNDGDTDILTRVLELTTERPKFQSTKIRLQKSEFLKLNKESIKTLLSFQPDNISHVGSKMPIEVWIQKKFEILTYTRI